MKEWFIKRGYPESVIEKEMKKVYLSKQGQKSKKVEKGVQFDVTYPTPPPPPQPPHYLINCLLYYIETFTYII